MIQIEDVTIDHFSVDDVPSFVEYWHCNSKDFWQQRGVELNPLPPKEQHIALMTDVIKNSTGGICTVLFRGNRIGAHPLTHRTDHEAIMHAHIWDEKSRGIGIATVSYVKAMEWFFESINLEKIKFHTPKANTAPIRVKEKLNIPILGSIDFQSPLLASPVDAWLSEVKKEDISVLKKRLAELYKN